MDINYYMKLQNSYGTKSKRERELAKVNYQMKKHFEDTYDTEDVLLNGNPFKLMIIKDTDGNTFKKKIKSPHDKKFNLGDYITWNNQVWLITLIDSDEKTWNRGYMYLCTILLRWQNSKGEIVERYAFSEDFTKYSTGKKGNNTIQLGDYQYGITLPVDNETKFIKRDVRFPIDLEGVEPPDVYTLTNRKVLLTDNSSFNRGGILQWTLSFSEFNPNTDKKITLSSGKDVWICDYNETTPLPPEPVHDIIIKHKGSSTIVAGGNSKRFYLTDYAGNPLVVETDWKVTVLPEFEKFVTYETLPDTSIKVKVDYNSSIIGNQIMITATAYRITKSIYVEIGGGI